MCLFVDSAYGGRGQAVRPVGFGGYGQLSVLGAEGEAGRLMRSNKQRWLTVSLLPPFVLTSNLPLIICGTAAYSSCLVHPNSPLFISPLCYHIYHIMCSPFYPCFYCFLSWYPALLVYAASAFYACIYISCITSSSYLFSLCLSIPKSSLSGPVL